MNYFLNSETLIATYDGIEYPSKIVNGVRIGLTEEECVKIKKEEEEYKSKELEYKLQNIRLKRNALLIATDYLALTDNTLTEPMKLYRQALRDITEGLDTVAKVNAVVFPNRP